MDVAQAAQPKIFIDENPPTIKIGGPARVAAYCP